MWFCSKDTGDSAISHKFTCANRRETPAPPGECLESTHRRIFIVVAEATANAARSTEVLTTKESLGRPEVLRRRRNESKDNAETKLSGTVFSILSVPNAEACRGESRNLRKRKSGLGGPSSSLSFPLSSSSSLPSCFPLSLPCHPL